MLLFSFFFIFNIYWRGLGFGGPVQVHSFHMPKAVSLYISSRCFLRTVYWWQQFISAFLISFFFLACYPPTSPFPCCMLITAHALTTTLTRSASTNWSQSAVFHCSQRTGGTVFHGLVLNLLGSARRADMTEAYYERLNELAGITEVIHWQQRRGNSMQHCMMCSSSWAIQVLGNSKTGGWFSNFAVTHSSTLHFLCKSCLAISQNVAP